MRALLEVNSDLTFADGDFRRGLYEVTEDGPRMGGFVAASESLSKQAMAPDDDTVLKVCDAINGAKVSGFEFSLETTRGDGRHWRLHVSHPALGHPDFMASVEFARRPLVLEAERLGFVEVHEARIEAALTAAD